MGVFNRAIPTIQSNNLNQLSVIPEQEPYVDDIFDPILNAEVRKYLLAKYGDPISATLGGYAEGIDNALIGQDGKWGILGSGMGILSGFGRSMDKAGDIIIGGLTEGVKGITGQGVESPLYNIFVEDEDYSGGRLLAAMGNSMSKLAGAPKLTEQDFTGLWNIPSMGLELMTDPGIMGGMLSKGTKALNLTEQVAQQSASPSLAKVGQFLQDYDDFTAKAAIDLTAPGLRQSATALLNKIEHMLGISSSNDYAEHYFGDDATAETASAASESAQSDPIIQSLIQKFKNISETKARIPVDENGMAVAASALNVPNSIKEQFADSNASEVDTANELLSTRNIDLITQILEGFDPVQLNEISTSKQDIARLIVHLRQLVTANDRRYSDLEDSIFNEIASTYKGVNQNLDLRAITGEATDAELLNDYRALYNAAANIRCMEISELNSKGINPEYASLNLFNDEVPPEAVELYLENPSYIPPSKRTKNTSAAEQQLNQYYDELWSGLNDSEEFYDTVQQFVKNNLKTGSFYDLTGNEATQNAIYRLAGLDPKARKIKKLDTPLTLSPSQFAGRSVEEYALGAQASYALIVNAFKKSGIAIDKYKTPEQLNSLLTNKTFVSAFPNAKNRKEIVDKLRTILFPDQAASVNSSKMSVRNYTLAVEDLVNAITEGYTVTDTEAASLATRIRELASEINSRADDTVSDTDLVWNHLTEGGSLESAASFGKVNPDDLFKTVRRQRTLIPWVKSLTGDLKGAQRVLFIEDLDTLNKLFDFEKSKNIENAREIISRFNKATTELINDRFTKIFSTSVTPRQFYNSSIADLAPLLDSFDVTSPYMRNIVDRLKHTTDIEKYIDTLRFRQDNVLTNWYHLSDKSFRKTHEGRLMLNEDKILRELPFAYDPAVDKFINDLHDLYFRKYVLHNHTFSRKDKIFLNKYSAAFLNDEASVARALDTADAYHNFWNNAWSAYVREGGANPVKALVRNLGEANDIISRSILDPIERRQGIVFDHNSLPLFEDFNAKDFEEYKEGLTRNASNEAKQYTGNRRRLKSASGDQTLRTHTSYTNFFRINAHLLDDPVFFKKFIHEYAPNLSKHYELKLSPEYFSKENISIAEALHKTDSPRTKVLAEEVQSIIDEFYTLFKDDVNLLLSHNYSPLTSLKGFKKREGYEDIYNALTRVQARLGYTTASDAGKMIAVPENYKAFRYIFKEIFNVKFENKIPSITFYKDGLQKRPYLPEWLSSHLTVSDGVNILNAKFKADYIPEVPVQKAYNKLESTIYTVSNGGRFTKKFNLPKETVNLDEVVQKTIQEASAEDSAKMISEFPTYADSVEQTLMDELVNSPEVDAIHKIPDDVPKSNTPNIPKRIHREKYSLFKLIHNAMAAVSNARNGNKATLRTDFVKKILNDADTLVKHGIFEDDIAKYQRAQIYLSGAKVSKEEFLNTLASSGMIEMAFKNSAEAEAMLKVLNHNASVVNVAAKGNVLKTFKHVLPNGNIATGIMFDTSNKNVVRMLEKSLKDINPKNFRDIVRLSPGSVTESVSKYISSEKYRVMDEFFDRVRQAEGEYAKVLGFKYDDTRHVKNVRNISPDVAEHYTKYLYKDINVSDLDAISEQLMLSPAFKQLRGSWGSRRFDKRLLGYAEDFEDAAIGSLFSHNASQIVKGSLGEGSFNNSKFQLYVDLFQNDNFKINSFVSDVSQLEDLFNAKLADGTLSGNMQNLVLAAPRFDNTGRVVGFTQFDKTTRFGLEQALNNQNTVLLPAHVFAPLDKVLRKDAAMSNKVYAFINKHLTMPFKFGVLMNPGFLIGNANDAYLKQATTMAHKYGTSVPEELANVAASIRDVMVLNNDFDNAYRKVLTHIASEGFTLAPTHHISELAASDPRIRKMLKDYVSNKLQKSKVSPIITCRLSDDEVLTIRTWLTLNSSSTTASFAAGLQDMDVIAKAKNSNTYAPNPNVVDRILMGKGEYVSDDISTWGLMVNNPIARKFMDVSEGTENLFRSAAILNDFRHKGLGVDYFKNYFNAKGSADFKSKIMEDFDVNLSEAINTMHNANFDYERMTDFTDTVGKFVPFPTFFLKNLGYWLDVFVNHPQYIDHAITVQENMWNGKDTEDDKFAAEAKGRGAIPLTADGQNMSNFFKGIYKPTPLQSMFGAFNLINNPIDDMYYRLHPLLSGGIAAASQLPPVKSIAADVLSQESIKYRPYSTDMYERNVSLEDENFNPLEYTVHRLNPMERATQNLIRLPDKLKQDKAQLSDFLPSIFQPDF